MSLFRDDRLGCLALVAFWLGTTLGFGQNPVANIPHPHSGVTPGAQPPKLFLDKSPKIVEYQLKRLSNAQLLLVTIDASDSKFDPVSSAILMRPGMSVEQRMRAASDLATIRKEPIASVYLSVLGKLAVEDRDQQRVASELSALLVKLPGSELSESSLSAAATDPNPVVRRAGLAGLITLGLIDKVQELGSSSGAMAASLAASLELVADAQRRSQLRTVILGQLKSSESEVRLQAIRVLPLTGGKAAEDFSLLAAQLEDPAVAAACVISLLRTDVKEVDSADAARVAEKLLQACSATPAAQRTEGEFIDRSQLIELLLPKLNESSSREIRGKLRELAVRVVRIKTVEEEMRYDLKFFAAEKGRPLQLVLENHDLMPHNLVITQPGALKEIALLAATMQPDSSTDGKQFVPQSEKVLHATRMVQAGKQDRLTFTAPATAGEYPFVCTYPNHWMRMYGVMVVVDDLDAFAKNPKVPQDPIGNNRSFVRNWKVDDFPADLSVGLQGRNREIGLKLFQEATCAQCHPYQQTGGKVGPDLTEVLSRNQNSQKIVLREILDPSHKIDPKYAAHSILTTDGKVFSGLIIAEDEKSISLVSSPDQSKPNIISKEDIEETIQSPKSLMPVGLLDQFTQDEIYELLGLLVNPKK